MPTSEHKIVSKQPKPKPKENRKVKICALFIIIPVFAEFHPPSAYGLVVECLLAIYIFFADIFIFLFANFLDISTYNVRGGGCGMDSQGDVLRWPSRIE